MLPSRQEIMRYDTRVCHEDEPVVEKESKPTGKRVDIRYWGMEGGEWTQVLIGKDVFILNPNRPDDVDPLKVAENFINAFDLQATTLWRKVGGGNGVKSNVSVSKNGKHNKNRWADFSGTPMGDIMSTEEAVTKEGPVHIYKKVIISFYRKCMCRDDVAATKRDEFMSTDLGDYLFDLHGDLITLTTARNKQRWYVMYMERTGLIEELPSHVKAKRYRFKGLPFGEPLPAQAKDDFDEKYSNSAMKSDLDSMRRNEDGLKC